MHLLAQTAATTTRLARLDCKSYQMSGSLGVSMHKVHIYEVITMFLRRCSMDIWCILGMHAFMCATFVMHDVLQMHVIGWLFVHYCTKVPLTSGTDCISIARMHLAGFICTWYHDKAWILTVS